MEFVLGIIYILVVGTVLVSMVALYLLGPDKRYKRLYLGCQASVVVWCMSQIFVLLSKGVNQLVVSYAIGNLGICMIGALWYYFACEYTGKEITGVIRYIPGLIAIFHYACVLTNPLHHLYYKIFDLKHVEHGVFFYTNVVTTYLFVVIGAIPLYADMGNESNGVNINVSEFGGKSVKQENRNISKGETAVKSDEVLKCVDAKNGRLLIVA